jgi:lantibiotic modifying enzyme
MNKKKILYKKLESINDILMNTLDKGKIGVVAGTSGISLFHFYYAVLLDNDEGIDRGVDIISGSIKEINEGYSFPTFCNGIAGTGWVIEFLKGEGFIDLDTDVLLSELDTYLLECMQLDIELRNLDFLHGALGYAYYFLKRYEHTNSRELRDKYQNIIKKFIDDLETCAQKDNEAVWWGSDQQVNIGLSHGMSSIINFLSKLSRYEAFRERVRPIIDQGVIFIMRYRNYENNTLSLFPNIITENKDIDRTSRLAWCSGDLGIGITLWQAGKSLNNTKYCNEALTILRHTTTRRSSEKTFVKDAGVCHGAAGVMNMYHYIYKQTNEDLFKEAMNYWMDEVINMSSHVDGLAGYKKLVRKQRDQESEWEYEWKNETNLLQGIAGIGLSIISYLATFDMKWDECLMIR